MYYLVFALLYLVSLLPLRVLYVISDMAFVLVYYVFGYRKQVVMENLAIAFPEKTGAERKAIARKFYRNFADNWIEALKLLSVPEKTLRKRVSTSLKALDPVYASGRCCHILLGHQFNWEWCNATIPRRVPFKVLVAYSPIANKIIDRLFLHLRGRFGCIMLPYNDMRRAMMPYRHSQYILGLVADQNPSNPLKSYWLNFLNKPTAFLQGPEKGARMGNIPVVYMAFSRPRRGYYRLEATLLHENPAQSSEGDITQLYVSQLEENIRRYPELYLWSHKRWKHEWKEEYRKLWVGEKTLNL
jgi:KDO2-lipid IV(A) lauroyltransferase